MSQASETRRSDRRSTPIRRSPASCIAIPTGCCSSWSMSARSIAGSVFAARWSGRARKPRCRKAPIDTALAYIRATSEIWEVILTGGDPLMLSPRRLAEIMADLARHRSRQDHPDPYPRAGRRSRAHQRRDGCRAEGSRARRPGSRCTPITSRELTAKARAACAAMIDAGIPMVSQSVLLRGVNDDAGGAGGADARLRRMPDQALLSAPWRSRAGHFASANNAGARPGTDAGACGGGVSGLCQPELRARYSRRPRQVAGRAELSVRRKIFFRRNVNSAPKRAIVSSTIAVTCISTRRSRDRANRISGLCVEHGRSKMRKISLVAATCLMLTAGSGGGRADRTESGSIAKSGRPWPAPVGHRQPRADQVPSEKNLSNPNDHGRTRKTPPSTARSRASAAAASTVAEPLAGSAVARGERHSDQGSAAEQQVDADQKADRPQGRSRQPRDDDGGDQEVHETRDQQP